MPDRRDAASAATRLAGLATRVADRLAGTPSIPAAAATTPAGRATAADVRAAYRLLLGREPDPSGAALYEGRLAAGALDAPDVAAELLASTEFADRWRDLVVARSPHQVPVEADGFTIVVDDQDWAVGATIVRQRDYEPEVSACLRSLLEPGMVFVDVGANLGWHALLGASAVGAGGTVVALEPNPTNTALLERSRERNRFEHLDIVTGAASDEAGWLALRIDGSNGAAVPLRAITATTRPEPCRYAVPAFRLDDLLEGKGLVDSVAVVKIDVEGLETRVLRGAARLLADARPHVVFEWFPQLLRDDGEDPGSPLRLLRDVGYAIGVVGQPSGVAGGPRLDDGEIEAVRSGQGRAMLDLVAFPPA